MPSWTYIENEPNKGLATKGWELSAYASWKLTKAPPRGIIGYGDRIISCHSNKHAFSKYNPSGEITKQCTQLKDPFAVDMDYKEDILYVADNAHVTLVQPKQFKISSFWNLPTATTASFRGLKVDGKVIYITVQGQHTISVHSSQEGTLQQTWGKTKEGNGEGEFNNPLGLTCDHKYVYICDSGNNRVQILQKDNGSYINEWGEAGTEKGQFTKPSSIYYHRSEQILYVGDYYSVQVIDRGGNCLQRIGDSTIGIEMNQFHSVYGICVMSDELYVSDNGNGRIQIFKTK